VICTPLRVGTDGTIDWYCCPAFDAPSSFGAILDCEEGPTTAFTHIALISAAFNLDRALG